jgi:adenylate cyclase
MDFAAEGLLDGLKDDRARAERIELLEELAADGVPPEELKAAVAEDRLVFLRVERTLGTARYTAREVADLTGIEPEQGLRFRQALGLPRPDLDERVLTDRDVEALRQLKAFEAAGLPEEGLMEMARVLGENLSRVAASVRLLVRDVLLGPDVGERELSASFAAINEHLGPQLGEIMERIFEMHLQDQLRNDAIGRAEIAHGRILGATEVTVAFADLVGFTKLGEQIPAEELGAIARRLLELATEAVHPPVRLVKTIGDAAMLVSPDAGALLEVSTELVRLAEAEGEDFPRLRAGLATGQALHRAGDWYGSPVNLASRVAAIARPGSVVATAATRATATEAAEAGGDGTRWVWSSLPSRRIKGVEGSVPLYRARPAGAEAISPS